MIEEIKIPDVSDEGGKQVNFTPAFVQELIRSNLELLEKYSEARILGDLRSGVLKVVNGKPQFMQQEETD